MFHGNLQICECQFQMHGQNRFCYGEGWFEQMKALLRDSTPALTIYKLGSFIRFKHNFALILFPTVSMGFPCMATCISLHRKALEHRPLILQGVGGVWGKQRPLQVSSVFQGLWCFKVRTPHFTPHLSTYKRQPKLYDPQLSKLENGLKQSTYRAILKTRGRQCHLFCQNILFAEVIAALLVLGSRKTPCPHRHPTEVCQK